MVSVKGWLWMSLVAGCMAKGNQPRPAMGWNTWNRYGCSINEAIIRNNTDAMIALGLKDAGYEFINIDDCLYSSVHVDACLDSIGCVGWQEVDRDAQGRVVVDRKAFPSGMKALADYIHGKGMKFGLYSSAGTKTCEKRTGGLGHETLDAQSYAEWDVDYLKYDNCFNEGLTSENQTFHRYKAMSDALEATGRDIVYSICNWGLVKPWKWGPQIGNSWRTTGDIGRGFEPHPLCPCCLPGCSVTEIIDQQVNIARYGQKGGFNDMDMLQIGNPGLNYEESKTHFAFWAALKSPLILGTDINTLSPELLDVVTNKQVIAINQDPLGVPATLKKRLFGLNGNASMPRVDVWGGPLSGSRTVALVLNRESKPIDYQLSFWDVNVVNVGFPYAVHDAWTGTDMGKFHWSIPLKAIPAHGTAVVILEPTTDA